MTINQYIENLRSTLPSRPSRQDWNKVEPMLSYARAIAKGEDALKAYRSKLIAKEINTEVNRDTQIAIMFNRDIEPEEYQKYQDFRAACKAKVDDYLANLQATLDKILKEAE